MLKNGIMSLIFKDIGIFKMDGVHIDESVKIWLAGFKNNYLQVFNYLEDTNKNVALGSSGIIEITFKNRPSTVIDKWWENLTKTQQILIKENPLLISFCHEFWADEFESIENFCDSINKKYEDVAIAFSNFNKEHQRKTKLKISARYIVKPRLPLRRHPCKSRQKTSNGAPSYCLLYTSPSPRDS